MSMEEIWSGHRAGKRTGIPASPVQWAASGRSGCLEESRGHKGGPGKLRGDAKGQPHGVTPTDGY